MSNIKMYYLVPLIITIVMCSIAVILNSKTLKSKTLESLIGQGLQIDLVALHINDIIALEESKLIKLRKKVIQTTIVILFLTTVVGTVFLFYKANAFTSIMICVSLQIMIAIACLTPLSRISKSMKGQLE